MTPEEKLLAAVTPHLEKMTDSELNAFSAKSRRVLAVTPKAAALAALNRAIEEAVRPDANMTVLGYLLADAAALLGAIVEGRARRKKKITGPAGPAA